MNTEQELRKKFPEGKIMMQNHPSRTLLHDLVQRNIQNYILALQVNLNSGGQNY
jgi:hypothetical protein